MSQTVEVELPIRQYTRADFTAMRAWLQRVPLEAISRLYYDEEAPQVMQGLERFLSSMREDLINRAVVANPQLAAGLANARKTGNISAGVMDVLVKAAGMKPRPPRLDDPIGQHFRPKVATAFSQEGRLTLADLVSLIKARGFSWWRSIPRIGAGRARTIERWLGVHGLMPAIDDERSQVATRSLVPLGREPLPLMRIAALPSALSGWVGRNRGKDFCYLQANDDLQALQSYLLRFSDQPHTLRAYTKELERFLLWCILVRKIAVSDVLVDDCEAYKFALAHPPECLTGVKAPRSSGRWRPFAGGLSLASQRMAITILRAAFEWLVSVRYLSGNPWVAVKAPKAEKMLRAIQVDKALPGDVFEKLLSVLDQCCNDVVAGRQWRIVRAAVLLMGESGLRRSEAVSARRDELRESTSSAVTLLEVLGKGQKWRLVPISARTMNALKAHWLDQNVSNVETAPLLSPLSVPSTDLALSKHADALGGYSAGGLANLVTKSLERLSNESVFEPGEIARLKRMTAHGFRHTFGSNAAAKGLPLDVLQSAMGHSSLDTTSIYVRAEERRLAEEAAKIFNVM